MYKNTYVLNIRLSRVRMLGFFVIGLFISTVIMAQAATTATLYPTSDGNYTQWTPNAGATHYTQVDETTCNGNTDYVSEATAGERDSFGVSLSAVPNGATITQISLTPCASRNSGGGGGSATMNVFYRFNGVNSADAGAYALTGTTPAGLSATNFSSLAIVKDSDDTLEVGAVYTSGTKGARLSRLATVITYTPAAPTVTTNAATSLGTSTATLNGTGNPNGASATGWFRYSTTNPGTCSDSFGTRVPTSGGTALGSGTTGVNYSNGISGLTPNTTYYYCAIASNEGGTSTASVQSFTTNAIPVPTMTTGSASSITASGATLNGTGNPNAYSTTGWFRYSSTNPGSCNDSFGTRAPVAGGDALGSGSSAVAYNEPITGLSEVTTYYYCGIGSNSGGTAYGSVQSFTTLAGTLPAAPSGAAATNVSGTQNDISWTDNASNEAGYKIERLTNGSFPYVQIATTSANATSFSDTSASADNTYKYRVRAYNVIGNSVYSTSNDVITATVVPNDPTSLTSFVASSTSALLYWSHTGTNEAGFKVERSTDNVNFSVIETVANNITTTGDYNLPSGTYYYRVYAYNAVGDSGTTNTETVIIP